MGHAFADRLLSWYAQHKRDLPWRKTTDPYAILVSELMLQQTQVPRVVPKYEQWMRAFPTWQALAKAERADVLRMWSGLGYNSRAARLHALAKLVVEEHGGRLPESEEELQRLPGIGPYTAGAIMVFAHNKPGSCIDVNVERIIRRVRFNRNTSPSKKELEKKLLLLFANETTNDAKKSGMDGKAGGSARDLGNALMDFGSAVCTARRPKCEGCPLYSICKSRGEREDERPLREKRKQSPFLHSNRWWRGQILRALLDGAKAENQIYAHIGAEGKDEFLRALRQLQEEKIVSRGERLRLL